MSFLRNKFPLRFSTSDWNLCFALLLVVATSCQQHKPQTAYYYDIDSLIDRQIVLLLEKKARLEKNANVGKQDSRVALIPPDSSTWAEEFEIFRNLNVINKPVNQGAYRESVERDRSSNLTVRSFVALEDDLPVERLQIFYLNVPQDIRRIEAVYREENAMYETRRNLRMDFRKRDAAPIVSAYSVSGGQKMLLGDTVQYAVTTKISIPQN